MARRTEDDIEAANDISTVKEVIRNMAENFNEQVSRLGDEIRRYAGHGQKELMRSVEEHPFKSVGIAALIGLIVGYLLHRRD